MKPRYTKPPYQPKWILRAQIWLLRRRVFPSFNRQNMIITTTGRKTGRSHAVPIGFARDGSAFLALNMGGKSHWYTNALANARVTLEIDGQVIAARAEPAPVDTPERLQKVLDVYRRERPGMFEGFMGISLDALIQELMDIGQYMAFMRFYPSS